MVDSLLDLEVVLRSKTEQLTLQEANTIQAWKARAQKDLYFGIGGGSAVAWLATRRLNKLLRHTLMFGAGAVCGVLLVSRSIESSVEQILSLEGSRMQRELANVMLKKHHNDPWVRRLVSKHFYQEEVYVDSSADKAVFRWRYRNFSGESVNHSQSTTSYDEEGTDPKDNKIDNAPKMEPKQQVSATDDTLGNPFDVVLGVSESAESANDDTQLNTVPVATSRRETRKEKRSRRRRRRQHHDEESDYE